MKCWHCNNFFLVFNIDIKNVNKIIGNIEGLLTLEKEFIKKSIKARKEEILDKAHQKIGKTI